MAKYVGAIDQGTTSSRFILFDKLGNHIASHQVKLPNYFPKPGWQEQDPNEIFGTVKECIDTVMQDFSPSDVAAVGITNQRETLIVWDRKTGEPLHNAIVWCDLRTDDLCHQLTKRTGSKDAFRDKCGLPISTYFSALKLRWLMENVPRVKEAADKDTIMIGTVDSWLLWKLTGQYVTDVSNASRTMLLNLHTKQWDEEVCRDIVGISSSVLPEIKSNSEIYGYISQGALSGIPVSGCIGDQQAALLGQLCLRKGEAKNTYGTGCFLLMNTAEKPVASTHGLLTTVAFQLGPHAQCQYALEGSVAVAGAAVTWLQDNLGLIQSPQELNALAASVPDSGGMYFVPAFSGLLSPYWRDDARGVMVGMTRYINKAHICRATLESAAYQTVDVLEAMQRDAGIPITVLKVDGGLSRSDVLCTVQADILGVPVLRPHMDERTALGAAFAAGLAPGVDVWAGVEDLVRCTSRGLRSGTGHGDAEAAVTSTSAAAAAVGGVSGDVGVENVELCDCRADKQGSIVCESKEDEEKHTSTPLATSTTSATTSATTSSAVPPHTSTTTSTPAYSTSPTCLLEASKAQFQVFEPHPAARRDAMRQGWAKAVEKSMGWAE